MPSLSACLAVIITVTRNLTSPLVLELLNAYLNWGKRHGGIPSTWPLVPWPSGTMGISKQNNWIEVPASREDEDPQSALAHSDFFSPLYFSLWLLPLYVGPSCVCLCAFLSTHHNPRPNHRFLSWWAKRDPDSSPLLEQPKNGPRLQEGLLERLKRDDSSTELKNWGRRLQPMSDIQFLYRSR